MAGFYPVKHWMAGYNLMLWDVIKSKYGGGRGIRTPEDLAALTDFKSVGFNHSPIPPKSFEEVAKNKLSCKCLD